MTSTILDLLTERVPLSTGAMAKFNYSKELEKKFSCVSRFDEPYQIFRTDYKHIWVPRAVAPIGEKDFRVRGFKCGMVSKVVPRNEKQVRMITQGRELLDADESFILQAATGTGKCLGKDTPVLMFNGRIKKVQDIGVNDLLMGPDSLPRRVKSTVSGREQMYRVSPKNGDSFTCNESHILSLKITGEGCKKKQRRGSVVNISVRDYLHTHSTFKHVSKAWATGVDFSERKVFIDPYWLGLWLGDGTSRNSDITNMDAEVITYIKEHAHENGCYVHEKPAGGRSKTFASSTPKGQHNPIRQELDYYELIQNKRIPEDYKINTREVRLQILAGLIDTDGSVTSGGYEITQVRKKLAEDIQFISRSLGFRASMNEKRVKGVVYYRIHISGFCEEIPVLIKRKKAPIRKMNKDPLVSGFSVEKLKIGYYYGFELEGPDRLFLLGDFTVTHNTVVCLDLICHVNRPALVIVPKDDLMQQWYDQALKFTNIPAKRIGFIQGDTCIYENKWLVIAMLHSIAKDSRYPPAMYKYFGQIFWDEAHRISAETFAESGTVFPALIRVGATATPQRSDGKETILEATIGPVKIIENGDPLKFKVLKWRSNWECPKVQVRDDDGTVRYVKIPHSAGKCGHVQNMLAKYKPDQEKVSEWAHKCYKKGRHTVIFSDRIEHLQALMQQCKQKGVPANEMSLYVGSYEKDGKKVSMSRDQKEKAKGKRLLFASYGAMKEGTDIPWVDTIIFAMPRSDVAQALGRMLREYEGKQKPTAFDIAHDDSPVFKAYGRARDKYYVSKKADVRWL